MRINLSGNILAIISCSESETATPDSQINQSFDLIGQIDFLKNKTQIQGINEWKTTH